MFISDEDVDIALHYLRDNAATAAKAKADRVYLEDYTKPLLAIIMSEHPSMAVNAQEREAWSDPRMLKHLEAKKMAVFEDEKHKFKIRAAEATITAWQTMNKVELAMKI